MPNAFIAESDQNECGDFSEGAGVDEQARVRCAVGYEVGPTKLDQNDN